MSGKTEMRQYMRELRRQGYTVTITGKGHWRISGGDLVSPLFTSGTPSDYRSLANTKAKLRRTRGEASCTSSRT